MRSGRFTDVEGEPVRAGAGGLLPGGGDDLYRQAVRTNWLWDPFTLGAYASFAPGQLTQFGEFGWFDDPADPASRTEVRFGNVLFAGEHTDVDWYVFMNGGASSGRQAAASVLRGLGML